MENLGKRATAECVCIAFKMPKIIFYGIIAGDLQSENFLGSLLVLLKRGTKSTISDKLKSKSNMAHSPAQCRFFKNIAQQQDRLDFAAEPPIEATLNWL